MMFWWTWVILEMAEWLVLHELNCVLVAVVES